jgi:hypothetical protein
MEGEGRGYINLIILWITAKPSPHFTAQYASNLKNSTPQNKRVIMGGRQKNVAKADQNVTLAPPPHTFDSYYEACRAADTHLPITVHHRLLVTLFVPVGQHLPIVPDQVVLLGQVQAIPQLVICQAEQHMGLGFHFMTLE